MKLSCFKKHVLHNLFLNVTVIYRCTFEKSFCQWKQLKDDQFDWSRNRGATASYGTGPAFDHTTGSSSGMVQWHVVYFNSFCFPRNTKNKDEAYQLWLKIGFEIF